MSGKVDFRKNRMDISSELSRDRVEDARSELKEGDEVEAKFVGVDRKNRGARENRRYVYSGLVFREDVPEEQKAGGSAVLESRCRQRRSPVGRGRRVFRARGSHRLLRLFRRRRPDPASFGR